MAFEDLNPINRILAYFAVSGSIMNPGAFDAEEAESVDTVVAKEHIPVDILENTADADGMHRVVAIDVRHALDEYNIGKNNTLDYVMLDSTEIEPRDISKIRELVGYEQMQETTVLIPEMIMDKFKTEGLNIIGNLTLYYDEPNNHYILC